jgi:hypothetical protein
MFQKQQKCFAMFLIHCDRSIVVLTQTKPALSKPESAISVSNILTEESEMAVLDRDRRAFLRLSRSFATLLCMLGRFGSNAVINILRFMFRKRSAPTGPETTLGVSCRTLEQF